MKNFHITTTLLSCLFLIIFNISYTQESQLSNGIDDDLDGFIDCGDTDSYGQAACQDAFMCSNTLYQVISKTLNRLNPLTGEYEVIGTASSSFNGAGYNVQDGYIYGHKSSSEGVHLWRISNQGLEKDMGVISNFVGRTYVGDFDEYGNLYTYINGNKPQLSYVDVNAESLTSQAQALTNLHRSSIPGVADITYNPVHKKFYGMSGGLDLIELDPTALTANVIADFTGQFDLSGSFGAAWSDVLGNSYFSNNATGYILHVSFDADGDPISGEHVATGQPTNSNDGMGCFLSLPPFETNCSDGIDNDGDGLIDCADPDCSKESTCPFITGTILGNPTTGPNGITPVHITLTNHSGTDTDEFSLSVSLPDGFSYLSDTLELLGSSDFQQSISPAENDRNNLTWSDFTIPAGDTIVISIGLLVDPNIQEDQYEISAQVSGVIMKPYTLDHKIDVIESLLYDAEPMSCEPAFYQVYKKKGEANVYGKLDIESAEYQQIAIIDAQLNGLGFDQNTAYAYGSNGTKFIRLDQQGNETYLDLDFDKKVFVGDVDDQGHWYGKVANDIVKVDIASSQIVSTFTAQGLPGWDMAFNKDGNFYAAHKDMLYTFNTTTSQKETLGQLSGAVVPLSGHGAQWTGKDGYHYISNNASGQIYRINVNTLQTSLAMQATPGLQFNDGFSCPTEIPPVFEYDYGDYNLFPVATQWVYAQDLNDDNIPDYDMVWIGHQIKSESLNPSNPTASGETDDDQIQITGEVSSNSQIDLSFDLNTNMTDASAHWGLWIDWNDDGAYDAFFNGQAIISNKTTITQAISLPQSISEKAIGLRIRTSTSEITEDLFSGEMTESGEVEDHLISVGSAEICGNDIDDDNDGLIDCDDPDCVESCDYSQSTSSQDGGLESNRRLSEKIASKTYTRIKNGNNKDHLSRQTLTTFSKEESNLGRTGIYKLIDFIPLDVIEGTESFINTPLHLKELTNAVDLFSIDIFNENKRVAAVLALETKDGVYEHTKYICDRLSSARILDILTIPIGNGKEFVVAKIQHASGDIEYASSLSIFENEHKAFTLESHWNLDSYSDRQHFYNFQIWSSNTLHLIQLMNDIIRLIETVHVIDNYSIGKAPELYIESGIIKDEQLILSVMNKAGVKYIETYGTFSQTETSTPEEYTSSIPLTGKATEDISINIGSLYDLGLTFYHPELSTSDAIFLADGRWGAQAGTTKDLISEYTTLPDNQFNEHEHEIKRNIKISGFVTDYINMYRSFNARFTAQDFDDFSSFNFSASGNATLEISILKESITDWDLQAKEQITLTPEHINYSLGKAFFNSIQPTENDWTDTYLIVFNILGDGVNAMPFDVSLTDVYFGDLDSETSYVIYTKSNLLQSNQAKHTANLVDGTLVENIEISSTFKAEEIVAYIENLGTEELLIDELDIINDSPDFSIINFEPTALQAGEKQAITILYAPQQYPSTADVEYALHLVDKEGHRTQQIKLSANSVCLKKDHISTIEQTGNQEFKVTDVMSTDAKISSGSIVFSAGESIELQAGFSLEYGATLHLINENRCEN